MDSDPAVYRTLIHQMNNRIHKNTTLARFLIANLKRVAQSTKNTEVVEQMEMLEKLLDQPVE